MKDDSAYLKHILQSANKIQRFTKNIGYEDFMKNDLIQSAVLREIEIIGEAAKYLGAETKNLNKEIPWAEIAKMRDKLIHAYFGVDLDIVWETVKKDIPFLKKHIRKIMDKSTDNP